MSERPRFYLDAHIDRVVLEALHAHGIDVEAAYDVGLRTAPDEEHLRYATLHGRVIVTRDHDFLAMHGLGIPHAGIIRVRRRGPAPVIEAVRLVHAAYEASEMVNRVEFL